MCLAQQIAQSRYLVYVFPLLQNRGSTKIQLKCPLSLRIYYVSFDHRTFLPSLGLRPLHITLTRISPSSLGELFQLAPNDHIILIFSLVPFFSQLNYLISLSSLQGLYALRRQTATCISNIIERRIWEKVALPARWCVCIPEYNGV